MFGLKTQSGKLETLFWVLLVLLTFVNHTLQQTNSEPVNIGLIVAIPWDISNTLRAPLGGPISLVLTAFLACILFLGLLLAPVNYIFGNPSRIYYSSRRPGIISDALYDRRSFSTESVLDMAINTPWINGSIRGNEPSSSWHDMGEMSSVENNEPKTNFPDFISSTFLLIPEKDEDCRKLIMCHAHGFLQFFPTKITKILQFFSKRMMAVKPEYKTAVIAGLKEQADCMTLFKCSKDISIILKEMLMSWIPDETKEYWKLIKAF